VPRLAKEAAVVLGKAESIHCGTLLWPAAMTERRNGVWEAFCLSRLLPKPSASTTQTRWVDGSWSWLLKPGTPSAAAELVKTSAIDFVP
jgi:hypothetical protein